MSGKASLRDLQRHHCINDLADLHELIDIEIEMQPKPEPKR